MKEELTLKIEKNSDALKRIRTFYSTVLVDQSTNPPIKIFLPILKWLSSNTLSHLLVLVQSLRSKQYRGEINVYLVGNEVVDKAIKGIINEGNNNNLIDKLKKKLIFYESMELGERLKELGVNVFPKSPKLRKLKEKLSAKKAELESEFSSRILALSPLIGGELEQHALTKRMGTLTNILYKNLYTFGREYNDEGREIDIKTIKRFSRKVMYELVKNIYQHSNIRKSDEIYSSGFGCAQIYSIPQISTIRLHKKLIESVLTFVRQDRGFQHIDFLSISINDWGVGLINRMRNAIMATTLGCMKLPTDKFGTLQELLHDDRGLLKLAVLTDYSSRDSLSYQPTKDDEIWPEEDEEDVKLEPKGYGFMYCLGFIAITLGRMRVTCQGYQLDIIAKPDASLLDSSCWKSGWKTAKLLKEDLDKYFYYKVINLPEEKKKLPGTQILIEIPVKRSHYMS